jgi:signal transduction histidine kinase/predicted metal-dependent HD superfamily phosphohydrolase
MDKDAIEKSANEVIFQLTSDPLIASILNTLKLNLSADLKYHCAKHTEDVLRETVLFGLGDNLSENDIKILATAAVFHDSGFLFQKEDHEAHGAHFAVTKLNESGKYTHDQISKVRDYILDTKLVHSQHGKVQIPTTPLAGYLLDADLSNLGRSDFFEKSELQRQEWNVDREKFLTDTLEFIRNHEWITPIAHKLRQVNKEKNIVQLSSIVNGFNNTSGNEAKHGLSLDQLQFLARFPLLINNTFDAKKIIQVTFEHAVKIIGAKCATIFLKDHRSDELIFWAIMGEHSHKLEGKRMPISKGIVGWVVENQKAIVVPDTTKDSRFFSVIDSETSFKTTSMLCIPLTVRGSSKLGALQILNKIDGSHFSEEDLLFGEQFANQVALAIDNIQLHEQLINRHKQLQAITRKKNEMLKILAHEFRTPLSIIHSAADIITDGVVNDQNSIAQVRASLEKGVERLSRISQQLKDMAFLGEDMLLDRRSISASALIKDTVKHFIVIAQQRKLNIKCTFDDGNDLILCDPTLISMVLYNLIANAIRFTPDEGEITIATVKSSGMIQISVTDNGIGIAKDQQEAIFDKFYEVGDAMNHSSGDFGFMSGGLGLGLSSVKTILEAHKASIQLESTLNKGSKFTFHLPLCDQI